MRSTLKKTSELLDLLKALTMSIKAKDPGLVPAIKPLTIKPLSMPSMTVSAPNKLPGIEPPSKKDPTKVAQQLKNPRPKKPKTEMIKINSNGQWSLSKSKDDDSTAKMSDIQPIKLDNVNASFNSWGHGYHKPEQDNLINGIDLESAKPVGRGVSTGAWMKSDKHPHEVIVKRASSHPNIKERGHDLDNFNSAKREVMFHNMARDFFDMGKYVPLTTGFNKSGQDYSAQKKIDDASHLDLKDQGFGKKYKIINPNHEATIKDLHDSGDLHKMAIMDHIMGHHDRHKSNYLLNDKEKGMHLIDNGAAFDYRNFDPRNISQFHDISKGNTIENMELSDKTLHPEIKDWLTKLDPKKAAEIFANHASPQSSEHVKGFMARLQGLKNKVKENKYKDVESLLEENRLSSGPMHPRHDVEKD